MATHLRLAQAPVAAVAVSPPLPGSGLVTANAPPLRLPGQHFIAATVFFVLGALGLAWIAPDLADGAFIVPRVAGVVHLFTLGFISTSIFGALYQFLPVAVGAPIRSQRVAHVTFFVLTFGIALFVPALAWPVPRLIPIGGGAVALAFLLFAGNLIATLITAPKPRTTTFWALACASLFLLVTLGLGFTLALQLGTGIAARLRFELLVVHVHVAVCGWVFLVMIGVGHKLLPMFMLSHGGSERFGHAAVVCIAAGCAALSLPLGELGHAVGFFALGLGVLAFFAQAATFYKHRTKRNLDDGMRLAMGGLMSVGTALVMAPFAFARGFGDVHLLTAYVFLVIVGGISLFVAGHYFKIVPFLVWYHRFGAKVGKGKVPRVADLYSARMARVAATTLALGVVCGALGILFGSAAAVRLGALVYLGGALCESREMIRIAWSKPA